MPAGHLPSGWVGPGPGRVFPGQVASIGLPPGPGSRRPSGPRAVDDPAGVQNRLNRPTGTDFAFLPLSY